MRDSIANLKEIRYNAGMNHRLLFLGALGAVFVSCTRVPEMTLAEIEEARASSALEVVGKTVRRPRTADVSFTAGRPGGTWNSVISEDPKSFNLLIAEKDSTTHGVLMPLLGGLASYEYSIGEWIPDLASFEIAVDEAHGSMDVTYTLRDDAFWSYYQDAKPSMPVTSDDVVFWYNEIEGDEACGSSAFNGHFMTMEDGSEKPITIEKLSEKRFVFHLPRIIADPILTTNMIFAPSSLYKSAKDAGGADAVKKLLSVATDPREIPSCGPYFLAEYTPGQRLVYKRNKAYYDKDSNGESHYYPETRLLQIVGDSNTVYQLFQQGAVESANLVPERLQDAVSKARNKFEADGSEIALMRDETSGYTVFNTDGSLSAPFWSFNQNPQNKAEPYYRWFTVKEFRQAMSCLLNRDRIITQTYRGLASPMYHFFPVGNRYYDERITLQYRFDQKHALALLQSAGFEKRADGFLYDSEGVRVSFDLSFQSGGAIISDIVQIIVDECAAVGIMVTPRPTDFQKLVDQLLSSYDWQSMILALSGNGIFPSQGSNTWLSSGNLHMWYPLQKTPATDWEARIDYLYRLASSTVEYEKAKPLWDEYQQIILEQCPLIYLVCTRSFAALQNRWDMSNMYYDNLYGAVTDYLYLVQ